MLLFPEKGKMAEANHDRNVRIRHRDARPKHSVRPTMTGRRSDQLTIDRRSLAWPKGGQTVWSLLDDDPILYHKLIAELNPRSYTCESHRRYGKIPVVPNRELDRKHVSWITGS
jgi:hypothetical protein